MALAGSFALAVLLAVPPVGEGDPVAVQADVLVELTLPASADPQATAERVYTWSAPRVCTAWIWCRSSETDPSLVVESPGHPTRVDDNGGDGTCALVRIDVVADQPLVIRARGAEGRCELQVSLTEESDATRALSERVKAGLEALKSGSAEGGPSARADWLATTVRELLDADPKGTSLLVSEALWSLAGALRELGELESTLRAYAHVAEQRERTLSRDHRDVLRARLKVAVVLQDMGEVERSVEIKREAVAALRTILPAQSLELLGARTNLASGLGILGQLDEAIEELRSVLDVESMSTPAARGLLTVVRSNLAELLLRKGDFGGARDQHETSLREAERDLGPDSPEVAGLRLNFAILCSRIGECGRARELSDAAIANMEHRYPADAVYLLQARMRAAEVHRQCGDFPAARALAESTLPKLEAQLGPDAPDVFRLNDLLATTLAAQGEYLEARDRMESQIARLEALVPDGTLDLELQRINLSNVLGELGDGQGSRSLLERAIAGLSGVLAPGHTTLVTAMSNLAEEKRRSGDHAGCLELQERALGSLDEEFDPGGTFRARLRVNIASTLIELGRAEDAEDLLSQALVVLGEDPGQHAYFLRVIRSDLALLQAGRGDYAGAQWQLEQILGDAPVSGDRLSVDALQTRVQLADILTRRGERAALAAEVQRVLAGIEEVAARSWTALSVREADNLARALRTPLQGLVSCTRTIPVPGSDLAILRIDQLLREIPLARAAALRRGLAAAGGGDGARELAALSTEITRLARLPDSSAELAVAVGKRARLERKLLDSFTQPADGSRVGFDLACVRARLGSEGACVAYLTTRDQAEPSTAGRGRRKLQLMAFVLREEGPPVRVHLGPWDPIEAAVDAWRSAMGGSVPARGLAVEGALGPTLSARVAGARLRALVLDPLAPALEGARHLHVTLDGMLTRVPLDALPEGPEDGEGVLGDRLTIELHESLAELCEPAAIPEAHGLLVAVGDVDYRAAEFDHEPGGTAWSTRNGAASPSFPALPATRVEVERLADLWPDSKDELLLLTGARASEPLLRAAAPRARNLHVATHAWSAPESLVRAADETRVRDGNIPPPEDARDRARMALSPLSFCGLALAGIDAGRDAHGLHVGSLDGEELASWDLSRCALAVFSACETALGTYQTGRGSDGLQRAARIAGARQVLCSLWPVPDAATSELMAAFYAGMWEHGLAPGPALWRAKCALRQRRDARGAPTYGPDAWAGWILWGPAP